MYNISINCFFAGVFLTMDILTLGIAGTLVVSLITIILFVLTIIFGIIKAVKKKFKKTFIILLIVTILFGVVDFFKKISICFGDFVMGIFNSVRKPFAVWMRGFD